MKMGIWFIKQHRIDSISSDIFTHCPYDELYDHLFSRRQSIITHYFTILSLKQNLTLSALICRKRILGDRGQVRVIILRTELFPYLFPSAAPAGALMRPTGVTVLLLLVVSFYLIFESHYCRLHPLYLLSVAKPDRQRVSVWVSHCHCPKSGHRLVVDHLPRPQGLHRVCASARSLYHIRETLVPLRRHTRTNCCIRSLLRFLLSLPLSY